MSMSERFKKASEIIANSTFCFAKAGGEGMVNKCVCECYANKLPKTCDAAIQREFFHKRYQELESMMIFSRKEILAIIKVELDGKLDIWYNNNVIE